MYTIGIIAEYNPFHNGHKYQIDKIKKKYPDSTIIVILSTSFTQRGERSILDKWTKTSIALDYGIDLVIELPFIFSTQSADIFAKGAIEILKKLKIDKLIFGSESNDINILKEIANTQINNPNYDKLVKKYLDKGLNYPTSMNKALKDLKVKEVNTPNDLLGLSYIKEIIKQNANIEVESIKRTNNFHEVDLKNEIVSASSIREAIKQNLDIKKYVPEKTYNNIKNINLTDDYFQILKYKILTENNLEKYLDIDEGIENRIKKEIINSSSYEELINNIKTKRYTYNKISRMLIHILCNLTKDLKKDNEHIKYIRILGFSIKGKNYLNKLKKEINLPILTKYNNEYLNYELLVTYVYTSILNEKDKKILIEKEYKNHPIIKK